MTRHRSPTRSKFVYFYVVSVQCSLHCLREFQSASLTTGISLSIYRLTWTVERPPEIIIPLPYDFTHRLYG